MKHRFQLKTESILTALIIGIVILIGTSESKAFNLSEHAQLSLITCSPGDNAATVYGHSAIRVKDLTHNYDLVFNYGIYDFEAPNFLYRFASGETDYLLAAYNFDSFVKSYQQSERSVYEQVLNLTAEEKQKIVDFLIWNSKKENRVYRYNFFFDNCATRVRDVIADNIDGDLSFREEKHSHLTLRQLVESYHGRLLWLTFLIDMAVSSESDREATFWEEMLLPDYLMNHFAEATKSIDNSLLVKETRVVYQAPESNFKSLKFISPIVVFSLLTLLVFWFSFNQFRRGIMKPRIDYWVFGFNGIVGLVLSWMAIYSEHPAMSPNYNLLWAIGPNLLFVIAFMKKKWRPVLEKYHILISIWLILFLCVSPFVPQVFHPVFYLLVLMILIRSVFHSIIIIRRIKSNV